MGIEAQYQAMPENCDFLRRARTDREFAEVIQSFDKYALGKGTLFDDDPPYRREFIAGAQALEKQFPGLASRYFYAGSRCFSMIRYLLSPSYREEPKSVPDNGFIRQAIYGTERLHPEANATQGCPIGFVPTREVPLLAEYLSQITREILHEYYDPPRMHASGVYKMRGDADEDDFKAIWDELTGMKLVYQQAAEHGEAMITVID